MRLPTLLLTLGLSATAGATPPAFARLKALVGDWEARTERGSVIRVSYRLIANDSVLVQRFVTASGGETETIFHPDGSRVIATHYCAQGNQPRLRLDTSTDTRFVFGYLDATNLDKPSSAHLVKLELQLAGADDYNEIETYDEGGKPDVTTLKFHRKRAP